MLFKVKVIMGAVREVQPVWVMGSLVPSPIMMSLVLMYKEWRDELLKSTVTWWEALLPRRHDGGLEVVLTTKWVWGCHGAYGYNVKWWEYRGLN